MSIEQCGISNSSGELVNRRSKPWGEVEEKTLIKKFFKGKMFYLEPRRAAEQRLAINSERKGDKKLTIY